MPKILVADDFALCREPIAEALRAAGYEVICAADGAEALSAIRDHRPDLVLLDVNMPRLDGFSVLRTIRRNPELSHTPVIMLTDSSERESVTTAAENKIQGYLLKSGFSLETLFARVKACLPPAPVATAASKTKSTSANAAKAKSDAPPARPASSATATADSPKPAARSSSAEKKPGPIPTPTTPPGGIQSLEDIKPLVTKSEVQQLVNDALELRPLGPTVQNVIAVTRGKECCAEDVAKAVTHDQAISISILKLANSSAYSRGRPVNSVKDAVQRIGLQEVRSLVMTLGVVEECDAFQHPDFDQRLFWEHSIACGLIASAIAKLRRPGKADDGFLWGMVHDVGRLLLLNQLPDESHTAWALAEQLGLPLEAVERRALHFDHCEILEKALEHWRFPKSFLIPVVNHHQSLRHLEALGPEHFSAAASVALANRLAHALLLGNSGNEVLYPLDDLIAALQISPAMIRELTNTIPDETRDLKFTMLARANTENWPDFALQVKEQLPNFNPLCVSAQPDVDAYRIFCQRVTSGDTDTPPNVGILYLRDADELTSLKSRFDAEADSRDASNIPLLVLCAKGKLDPANPWLKTKTHAVLTTPVRVSTLLATLKQLLSS